MECIVIKGNGVTIEIFEHKGTTHIAINGFFNRAQIDCKNAGLPGIVGPDLNFNLGDLVKSAHNIALKQANS